MPVPNVIKFPVRPDTPEDRALAYLRGSGALEFAGVQWGNVEVRADRLRKGSKFNWRRLRFEPVWWFIEVHVFDDTWDWPLYNSEFEPGHIFHIPVLEGDK